MLLNMKQYIVYLSALKYELVDIADELAYENHDIFSTQT